VSLPNVQPVAQPTRFVSFSAEIIPATTEVLIAAMAQCANEGVEDVQLLLSTPGGTVMNGLNLYNVLRAMPFKLTTHNVGNVDSIGNSWQETQGMRLLTPPSCSTGSVSMHPGESVSKRSSCVSD
jgi:ATP-dependent protease ClpP protease subunit